MASVGLNCTQNPHLFEQFCLGWPDWILVVWISMGGGLAEWSVAVHKPLFWQRKVGGSGGSCNLVSVDGYSMAVGGRACARMGGYGWWVVTG